MSSFSLTPTSMPTTTLSSLPSDTIAGFPQIPIDNTLGAWFIGAFFSVFLCGITYLQAYQYWRVFPNDHRFLKLWVGITMILETFSTILVLHASYYYAVALFWDPVAVLQSPPVWSARLLPITGSVTAVVSQCFFARRVWIMSPKFRPVVVSAVVLMLGYNACYIVLSVRMFQAHSIPDLFNSSRITTIGTGIQMSADLIITSSLTHILRYLHTGFDRTDSTLDHLMAYALSTGLVTFVFHIVNVVSSAAWPHTLIWVTSSCILIKLYATNLLVALNSRRALGIMAESREEHGMNSSSGLRRVASIGQLGVSRSGSGDKSTASQASTIQLKIVQHTVSETHSDFDDGTGALVVRPTHGAITSAV